jgi:hypothetical protein
VPGIGYATSEISAAGDRVSRAGRPADRLLGGKTKEVRRLKKLVEPDPPGNFLWVYSYGYLSGFACCSPTPTRGLRAGQSSGSRVPYQQQEEFGLWQLDVTQLGDKPSEHRHIATTTAEAAIPHRHERMFATQ